MKAALLRLWRRAHRRIGPSGLAALLLLTIAAVIGAWLPAIDRDAERVSAALVDRQAAAARAPVAAAAPRSTDALAEYVERFPGMAENALDLAQIFASARRHRIELVKGEYQLRTDGDSPLVAYSATFPVRAQYGAIKEFAADVMLQLPHASLDELRLSREAAGVEVLDSVIRFTLVYRRP